MSSTNESPDDKLKSALIRINTLQNEYDMTLQQYQEACKNYINLIQTNQTANFTSLPGRSWWGTGGLAEGPATTEKECEDMCTSSAQCSGATFNPVKRYCWTRSGDSGLSVGQENEYALITQEKEALVMMKFVNDQLLDLNLAITQEFQNITPEVKEQNDEKNEQQQKLVASYEKLREHKIELDRQLGEYHLVKEEQESQLLYTNQQNIHLRFWIFVTCIMVIITTVGFYFMPLIVLVVFIGLMIGLSFFLHTPAGFMMCLVVILVFVLSQLL